MSIVQQIPLSLSIPTLAEKRLRDEFLLKLAPHHYPLLSQCAIEVKLESHLMGYRENHPHEPQGILDIFSPFSLDKVVQEFISSEGVKRICENLAIKLLPGPAGNAADCLLERELVCKGSARRGVVAYSAVRAAVRARDEGVLQKHFEGRVVGRFNPYRSGWTEYHNDSAGGDNLFDCLVMNPSTRGGGKEFLMSVMTECLTTGHWDNQGGRYKDRVPDEEGDVCIHYVDGSHA